MTRIIPFALTDWRTKPPAETQQNALYELEDGGVLFFPQLNFPLESHESPLLVSTIEGNRKNISLNLQEKSRVVGVHETKEAALHQMMERFVHHTQTLVHQLLPHYKDHLIIGRTSFRPVEIVGRTISWRKDDTRLHVDSFPATPVQDKRILRVFSNINPAGKPRAWRLGESFEKVAARFMPIAPKPIPGSSAALQLLQLTKSARSHYDHYMLQLHDHMKADLQYQTQAHQTAFDFPAGSTWITFTDQVSHAAMAGQHLLEQTFYLPVHTMQSPDKSPLRVLEKITGRKLA